MTAQINKLMTTPKNAKEMTMNNQDSETVEQKVKDLKFVEVRMGRPRDDSQYAHHAEWGSFTVLDRLTGFGYRDVETGFRDPDGRFWLASGNFSIRMFPELTIKEAIAKIKENANTCQGC